MGEVDSAKDFWDPSNGFGETAEVRSSLSFGDSLKALTGLSGLSGEPPPSLIISPPAADKMNSTALRASSESDLHSLGEWRARALRFASEFWFIRNLTIMLANSHTYIHLILKHVSAKPV